MRLVLLSCLFLTVPLPAWACGGCFSPGGGPGPVVVQNQERVLFVRDPVHQASVVWVEVVYSGNAQEFGWVLPLPKVPQVAVGTRRVFDGLDERLRFAVARQEQAWENCRDPHEGCQPQASGGISAMDAQLGADTSYSKDVAKPLPDVPGVTVLAQGAAGPYDYSVIQGDQADGLYKWLTTRGYATPEKAKPILQKHADHKDVFLAIRLQNGQGIDAIRPVALTLPDAPGANGVGVAEPCVPLRLTAIAAADEMTVAVTVAGPGRAVVKNGLDVQVNPLRLTLLGTGKPAQCGDHPGECQVPSNYEQVLSAAIDEAGGHAFVTEASQPGATMAGLAPPSDAALTTLQAGKTLYDVATFLAQTGLTLDAEVEAALQPGLTNPAVGPLFMQLTFDETVQTLKACGTFWSKGGGDACQTPKLTLSKQDVQGRPIEGATLAQALQQEVLDPAQKMADLLTASARVTRLVLRISPDEMDRDPVFAFHPSLPPVDRVLDVKWNRVCTDGWTDGPEQTRLTVPKLGSWLVAQKATVDAQFQQAPAAMAVTLQDEAGTPLPVPPAQVAVVDQAILGAKPGAPSLPDGLAVAPGQPWTPPPGAAVVTQVGPWRQPYGCTPKAGWKNGQVPPGSVATTGAADALGEGVSGGADASGSSPGKPTSTETPVKKSGCTAGRGGSRGVLVVLGLLVAAMLLRRRGIPVA